MSISHTVFDAAQKGTDPNQNPLCGKSVRVTRFNEDAKEERSVDLRVVDRCECFMALLPDDCIISLTMLRCRLRANRLGHQSSSFPKTGKYG